ncbi:outer membrane beta-barrel domain-containing protein [Bdellovibrio sp. SKB1291214]|uniref:outer membrane beta-barrel domain-containing protein n=1 Tax=Bdellovibrio sp. SKB1291214 TaxID=1732569 RepID=UPI000B515DBC|nr:outer membrane beta-barrel domain-containing protein [Bdellovibrio sp. SKB1291214]UYL08129.1 outer membrane beta-barrel domain-containing protein [Bdellovibrio sp. SKB1291214]
MKNVKFLSATFLFIALCSQSTFAAPAKRTAPKKAAVTKTQAAPVDNSDVTSDIDSLGGNEQLMNMAQNIKSESRSRIVQERIVDRRNRLEVGVNYGMNFGGDAYTKTQALGAALDFHITPRWSLGARYYDYGNSLTPEGKRIFDQAKANYAAGGRAYAVDIDYPESALMAVINWYPIYGKTSFMDIGVTQFDMYLLGGGGQITLSSGSTPVYTAGLGIGAWMSKHLTARAEIRYMNYTDKPVTGERSLDVVTGNLGFGWIL